MPPKPKKTKTKGRVKLVNGGTPPLCTICKQPMKGHMGTPKCPVNEGNKKKYEASKRMARYPWRFENGQKRERTARAISSLFEEGPGDNNDQAVDNATDPIQYYSPLLTGLAQTVVDPNPNPDRYTSAYTSDFAPPPESIFNRPWTMDPPSPYHFIPSLPPSPGLAESGNGYNVGSGMGVPTPDYAYPRPCYAYPSPWEAPSTNFDLAASGSQSMPDWRIQASPSSSAAYDPNSPMQPPWLPLSSNNSTTGSSPAGYGSMAFPNYGPANPSPAYLHNAEGPSQSQAFPMSHLRSPLGQDLSSTRTMVSRTFTPGDQFQTPQADLSAMYGYGGSNISGNNNDFWYSDRQYENDRQY